MSAQLDGLLKNSPTDDLIRWRIIQERVQLTLIERAFVLFRHRGIEPILLKGWSVARFYPNPQLRLSADIDFAVSTADFKAAQEFVKTAEFATLSIDLHQEFRHLDSLPWGALWSRSQLINNAGGNIRVLSPEDNLRVVCVHWLTDGGERRDRLWDIYYLVKNRSPDFNWEWCLDSVNDIRRHWIIMTIALAHRLLGLKIADLPFAAEIKSADYIPTWVLETILQTWQNPVPILDLRASRQNRKLFWQQLRKRLPPNPIHATVDVEAKFDNAPRLPLQMLNMARRFYLTVRKS